MKELETSLNAREAKVVAREGNLEKIKTKANDQIKKIRDESSQELIRVKDAHQVELERLQQELQKAAPPQDAPKEATPAVTQPAPDGMVNTEDLPRPTVTDQQLKAWLKNNTGAYRVFVSQVKSNLQGQMAKKDEMIKKLEQEIQQLKTQIQENAQKVIDGLTGVKQEPEQAKEAGSSEDLAAVNAAWEKKLKEKLEELEAKLAKTHELKSKLKDSQLKLVRTRFGYVEKAAKETPTEEVAKVYAIALQQKPVEAAKPVQPATPAKPAATQGQAPTSTPQQQHPPQPTHPRQTAPITRLRLKRPNPHLSNNPIPSLIPSLKLPLLATARTQTHSHVAKARWVADSHSQVLQPKVKHSSSSSSRDAVAATV